jgi:hypothetical protein
MFGYLLRGHEPGDDQPYAVVEVVERCNGAERRSMPAFRAVVSVLVSFVVRTFSTN